MVLAISCLAVVSAGAEEVTPTVHTETVKIFDGDLKTGGNIKKPTGYNGVYDGVNGSFYWESKDSTSEQRTAITPVTPINIYVGRIYQWSVDLSASVLEGGTSLPAPMNHQFGLKTTGRSDANGGYVKLKNLNNNSFAGRYTQLTWNTTSIPAERTTFTTAPYEVVSVPSDINGGLYETFSNLELWVNKNSHAALTFYDMDLEETITRYDTKFNIGSNGSVHIASYADLDGENAVSNVPVANGSVKAFEKNTTPSVMVLADVGYVIDTLSYNGTAVEGATGETSYTYTMDKIAGVGDFTVTFKESDEVAQNFEYISLSSNKTLYNNESCLFEPIIVKGYDSEGNETDITGSKYLSYTIKGTAFNILNRFISTGTQEGISIVGATYKNADGTEVKTSVIFQKTSKVLNKFNQANYTLQEPGHAEGSTSCFTWPSSDTGGWALRAYLGSNNSDPTNTTAGLNWKTNSARLASGWFYDDGVNKANFTAFFKNKRIDARNEGVAFDSNYAIGKSSATATNYGTGTTATKGWHQVVIFIDNSGYVNSYVDGILVRREVMPTFSESADTDYSNYFELRASKVKGVTSKFDELYIADFAMPKTEYDITVQLSGGANVSVNGTSVSNNSVVTVSAGQDIVFRAENKTERIATIEKVDPTGFNRASYTVNAKNYTITDTSNDAVYKVTLEKIGTPVEKEVFYEDFKGTAKEGSSFAITNRNRKLSFTNAANTAYDADNGYVSFSKADGEGAAVPYFTIQNNDGTSFFNYYIGRSYRYDINVNTYAIGQYIYLENAPNVNGKTGVSGSTITMNVNHDGFQTTSKTLNIESLSSDNGVTWTATSKPVDRLALCSFVTDIRTFNELKITEIKYTLPVTLTKSGNGVVSFTEIDDVSHDMTAGENAVEIGDRTFKFTPDEGYKIKSVSLNGASIPVTNVDGFETVLAIEDVATLDVEFAEKTVTKPSVTTGEFQINNSYDYSVFVPGAAPSKSIIAYATVDLGYGHTVSECGYYITNADGVTITLPATAVPAGLSYGIRMVGPALVAGTYTIQSYVKLSDGEIIRGAEQNVQLS